MWLQNGSLHSARVPRLTCQDLVAAITRVHKEEQELGMIEAGGYHEPEVPQAAVTRGNGYGPGWFGDNSK